MFMSQGLHLLTQSCDIICRPDFILSYLMYVKKSYYLVQTKSTALLRESQGGPLVVEPPSKCLKRVRGNLAGYSICVLRTMTMSTL